MKGLYDLFEDAEILAFYEENNRITHMNKYTKELFFNSKPVVEYILDHLKMNDTFDVIVKYDVYRLIKVRVDEKNLILGVKISDLKEKESHLRKESVQCERRLEEMLAYSDLIIHDINNYLFMAYGYLSLAEEENSVNYIEELRNILDSMRILVGRTSLLLKIRENYLPTKERLNVKRLLDSAIERLENKAKEKHIEIVKNYSHLYIYGDPMLIEAFINLIDNAIKYSPPNSKVEIEIKNEKTTFIVRIKDYGPGIPDEFKEWIFKRFMRRSTKQGMGLGLAVVKHLVELNNGRVWVEDNYPTGSIFNVELPKK